jgi:hypothetical protein
MSNYLPDYQKKNRIARKRQRELVHAIKNCFSAKEIASRAERLREAKIAVCKSRLARKGAFPHTLTPEAMAEKDSEARRWLTLSIEDIIENCIEAED